MGEVRAGEPVAAMSFVFTDVVGSTKLWAADPQATATSFAIHDELVRSTVEEHGGEVFGWAGDSFRAAFAEPAPALRASQAIHDRLAAADWSPGPRLRVRIGITRGPALTRDGDYFGPVLNTAARLCDIGWPGQTVLAADAAAPRDGIVVTSLGRHRLRDVPEAVELCQLGDTGFGPLRTVDAALSTIPPSPGALIGRSSAVAEIRSCLDDGCPVTVVGTGGAGKTRVAVEVGHLELSDHPDGCYFVDLTAVSDPSGVAPAIARSTRMKLAGGDPLFEIVDHFSGRHALIVLDNCEHVLATVRGFVKELSTADGLDLLATSREALGVPGERLVSLGPLPTGADGPAVALFVDRIHDNAPDFDPDDRMLERIAEICRKLDGIPLALELAASRAGVAGLDHLLAGMHDRFGLLSTGGDGSRTLRQAIDWSFGLLSETEQRFFMRCGVFNGTFDLDAAAAIVPDTEPFDVADLLHSLSRKSLIVAEGPLSGRFRFLETIRTYALMRLRELDLEHDVRALHFAHYCKIAGADDLATANDLDRGTCLAADWSNIAGALEWGTATGRSLETAHLAAGCIAVWEDSIDAIEGKLWADRILADLDPDEEVGDVLMTGLAGFEAQLDNFERIHELLSHLTASRVPEISANALSLTGYIKAREHPEESLDYFERAEQLVLTHRLGPDSLITALWTRGSHALYAGDLGEAHRCFRRGFDEALQMPTRTINTIYAGLSLATVEVLLGRPADAVTTLDSYNWSASRWDSSPIIRGVALIDLGQVNAAADLIFAYAHDSLLGRLHRMSNDALIGLAALALHRGEADHAWKLMCEAVTPRTPFTIGLVEGLAGRVGSGDALRTMHRSRRVALAELDAIDHLRAELSRLETSVSERG